MTREKEIDILIDGILDKILSDTNKAIHAVPSKTKDHYMVSVVLLGQQLESYIKERQEL